MANSVNDPNEIVDGADIVEVFNDLRDRGLKYVASKNAYRSEKAKMLLDLVDPKDKPEGWKKPTESVLTATLDANSKLQLLRAQRDQDEVEYLVSKLVAQWNVAHGGDDDW